MSSFELSSSIPNYIQHRSSLSELSTSAVQHLLDGDLLVIDNVDFGVDLEPLRIPESKRDAPRFIKKAKLAHLLAPIKPGHMLTRFVGQDLKVCERFQKALTDLDGKMKSLVERLYPELRLFSWNGVTYRPSISEKEGMHFDSYAGGQPIDKGHVRIFYNIDVEDRIWETSYRVDEAISHFGDFLHSHINRDNQEVWRNANSFNKLLVKCLPWDTVPRHKLRLSPLTLWLYDGQVISHEIVYGRRLVAGAYPFDPTSVPQQEKEKLFANRSHNARIKCGLL